jgi:pilus assembly protein CpaE
MTSNERITRVVAIGDPGPTQQQIGAALSAQTEFQLADILNDLEKLVRELRAAEPHIILIDHTVAGQPTLDLIDDLAAQVPEAAIIAILPDSDPLKAQQVTLAGARAFIVQPFTQVNLLSTLRRVRDLESRRARLLAPTQPGSGGQEKPQPLRTLAVFSPRGGVGCSTLAANLAVALHEATGLKTLLLEGKLFFGHLDVLLNIRTHNTLADLIPHANALDEGLVRDVVVEHVSGIDVLLGPSDLQAAQGIRPQDLFSVISALQRYYEFIIIDAGSLLNDNIVTLLDAADKILMVTAPDLAALHDASRFIGISHTLAYPPGKLLVLLNRSDLAGGVKIKDIQTALHHELFSQIPDDGPNALRSLNRGIPLILKYPRSPASKAILMLARQFTRLNAPEAAKATKNSPAGGRARLAQKRPA